MKNPLQQEWLRLSESRVQQIRAFYPNFTFTYHANYTLDFQFQCKEIIGVNEEIQSFSKYFILNTRGFISRSNDTRGDLLVSDYQIFNTYLEEETINTPCGNWYAEAYFVGEHINSDLVFHFIDKTGYAKFLTAKEDYDFTSAFNAFYSTVADISQQYESWKKFKDSKDFQRHVEILRTGIWSRGNAKAHKFYLETDKYYRNVLGIGRNEGKRRR